MEEQEEVHDYREELENALVNLVVSLCQEKAKYTSLPQAKDEVHLLLLSVAKGLKEETNQ